MIIIDVLGTPAPKGSVHAFYRPGMKRAVVIPASSTKERTWARTVRKAAVEALEQLGLTGPVFVDRPLRVEITCLMPRPAGHWGTGRNAGVLRALAPQVPMTKPDGDKLLRTTWDALIGVVFDDDARIADGVIRKRYAEPGKEGARITIEEWKA